MHDHGACHGVFQCRGIASVVEKADVVWSGRLQRRDAAEHSLDRRRGSPGGGRNGGQRMRTASGKEPRIAHRGLNHRPLPFGVVVARRTDRARAGRLGWRIAYVSFTLALALPDEEC